VVNRDTGEIFNDAGRRPGISQLPGVILPLNTGLHRSYLDFPPSSSVLRCISKTCIPTDPIFKTLFIPRFALCMCASFTLSHFCTFMFYLRLLSLRSNHQTPQCKTSFIPSRPIQKPSNIDPFRRKIVDKCIPTILESHRSITD